MKKFLFIIFIYSISNSLLADDKKYSSLGIASGYQTLRVKGPSGEDPFTVHTKPLIFYGEFKITKNFGIEFDLLRSASFTDPSSNLKAKISGVSVTPIFSSYIYNNLGVYFKSGLQYTRYKQETNAVFSTDYKSRDFSLLFGTGLQYKIKPNLIARLNYKHINPDLDKDITIDSLSLSIHY